jgi:hypothetical protein
VVAWGRRPQTTSVPKPNERTCAGTPSSGKLSRHVAAAMDRGARSGRSGNVAFGLGSAMKKSVRSKKSSQTSAKSATRTASLKTLKPKQPTSQELQKVVGGLGSRTAEK